MIGARPLPLQLLLVGLAVLAGLLALFPLYWALISSLRPGADILKYLSPLQLWTFIPNRLSLENYSTVLGTAFGRALWNSIFVSAATIVLGLVVCTPAAFALAKLRLPGASFVFSALVLSFLIPGDATAVPLATIFRGFGLQNTYWGIILPAVGNGLVVFLLRQFFIGIPSELSDAAQIDGAGWFTILLRIYLPLSVPALIAASLILFTSQWQGYLWPLLIAPDPAYEVASVAIANFAGEHAVDFGAMFAGTIFVSAIPLVVLIFTQRYFTASIATAGVK